MVSFRTWNNGMRNDAKSRKQKALQDDIDRYVTSRGYAIVHYDLNEVAPDQPRRQQLDGLLRKGELPTTGKLIHRWSFTDGSLARLIREGGLECLPNEAGACLSAGDGESSGVDTEGPSVRSLTAEDYAAGFALSRIGTDESHDFSAPPCAEVCEDWRSFGSSRDWFRTAFTNGWGFAFGTNRIDALTVFSYGTARPKMRDKTTYKAKYRRSYSFSSPIWAMSRLNDSSA